jgi:hypothetical protein
MLDHTQSSPAFTPSARAMVARSLTRLTVRLTRKDWWTWSSPPDGASPATQQLRLEPSIGRNYIPGQLSMQELAVQRRVGKHPSYGNNWGAVVCALPDLKIFELVLETWAVKKQQLETVVECAQTWKFPLVGRRAELVWTGTNVANWKREDGDAKDFVKKRSGNDYGQNAASEEYPIEESNSAGRMDLEESDDADECSDYDERGDPDEPDEDSNFDGRGDDYPESDQDLDDDESEDDEYDFDVPYMREERWDVHCKEFEVRVVRFKRTGK